MTYNFDNINEFFEDLNKSLNPQVSKMLVYSGYMRDKELKKQDTRNQGGNNDEQSRQP